MEISTSILNATDRIKAIAELNTSNTDYIHFDVMDGIFVDNKQFSLDELIQLIPHSKKKNDVHLMVSDPIPYINAIKDFNVEYITIHVEINKNIKKILDYIKSINIKCGLAVDLNTNINELDEYLNDIDLILIMSVKAGYGGQEFEERVLKKISNIPKNIKVEIDGGINEQTISLVKKADIVVSGNYILKNVKTNIDILKAAF